MKKFLSTKFNRKLYLVLFCMAASCSVFAHENTIEKTEPAVPATGLVPYSELLGYSSCYGHSVVIWRNAGEVFATITGGCSSYTYNYTLYINGEIKPGSGTSTSGIIRLGSSPNYNADYWVDITGRCSNNANFGYNTNTGSGSTGGGSYVCSKQMVMLDAEVGQGNLYLQINPGSPTGENVIYPDRYVIDGTDGFHDFGEVQYYGAGYRVSFPYANSSALYTIKLYSNLCTCSSPETHCWTFTATGALYRD